MKTLVIAGVTLVLVATVACTRGSGDTTSAPAGSGAAVNATPPAAPAAKSGPLVIEIPKLGLKGLGAKETEAPIVGSGDPVLIMAASFTVNVSEAKSTDPKTLKQGQEAAKLFTPKNMQTETLADGWALTYENTGSAGTNYFVSVRREIGGKGYLCETTLNTPEQQKDALAFCKTLSK